MNERGSCSFTGPFHPQTKSRDRESRAFDSLATPAFRPWTTTFRPMGLSVELCSSGFQRFMHCLMPDETEWAFCSVYT